jgi:peptide/nickel transport system substrate-binding protein
MGLWLTAACGPCGFQPDPGVKIIVPAMPTTLDWSYSDPASWSNYPVMLATQKGLTTLGADNSVQPGLAERWERERDAQGREVYTFHLRQDVRWSDGVTPLTAQDFVFGWRRAMLGRERGEMAEIAEPGRPWRCKSAVLPPGRSRRRSSARGWRRWIRTPCA